MYKLSHAFNSCLALIHAISMHMKISLLSPQEEVKAEAIQNQKAKMEVLAKVLEGRDFVCGKVRC